MDKFEMLMQKMREMPPEEQVKMVESNRAACICPGCPTYTSCAKNADERLFCSTGKSFMCISEEKSCLCPTCPVHEKMGLKYQFYCIRGSEKAQRYESTLWGTKII